MPRKIRSNPNKETLREIAQTSKKVSGVGRHPPPEELFSGARTFDVISARYEIDPKKPLGMIDWDLSWIARRLLLKHCKDKNFAGTYVSCNDKSINNLISKSFKDACNKILGKKTPTPKKEATLSILVEKHKSIDQIMTQVVNKVGPIVPVEHLLAEMKLEGIEKKEGLMIINKAVITKKYYRKKGCVVCPHHFTQSKFQN